MMRSLRLTLLVITMADEDGDDCHEAAVTAAAVAAGVADDAHVAACAEPDENGDDNTSESAWFD